jgi:hypothetical protein
VWCFDTAEPDAAGGYPIVACCRDGEARFVDTAERTSDRGVVFTGFAEWFEAYRERLCTSRRDRLRGFA